MALGKALTPQECVSIAQGLALGKTHSQVAAECGVSKPTVDRAHKDPRIGPMIQRLKQQHCEKLEALYEKALEGIERDLDDKEASIRVQTRNQVLKFIESGEAQKVDVTNKGDFTLEELLISYTRARSNSE